MKKVYTTSEAAQLLNYTTRNVTELCRNGKIKNAFRVQGKRHQEWRIPGESLREYMESQEPQMDILDDDGELVKNPYTTLRKEIEELKKENQELKTALIRIAEHIEKKEEEVAEKFFQLAEGYSESKQRIKKNEEELMELRKVSGNHEEKFSQQAAAIKKNEEEVAELENLSKKQKEKFSQQAETMKKNQEEVTENIIQRIERFEASLDEWKEKNNKPLPWWQKIFRFFK